LTANLAATILQGVGSVGLSLVFWVLGFLIASAQLGVYVELASFFPNRSGAEVVYLEQAYPKPKYLLPTTFAIQSVLFSFSSSNAIGTFWKSDDCGLADSTIVMAQFLYATGGFTPSAWQLKGLAVGCMTFIVGLVIFSTQLSLRLSNAVGVLKLTTLLL
jgi:amino acid transporter